MSIGSIGRNLGRGRAELIDIDSHRALSDFDIVIFDLVGIESAERRKEKNKPNPRWRFEVEEFLKLGRTVVVLLASYPLEALLPVEGISAKPCEGKRTELKRGEPFVEFWQSIGNLMSFKAYLQGAVGKGFLYMSETDRVVGAHLQVQTGNIIFLPSLPPEQVGFVEYENKCELFVNSLKKLVVKLKPQQADYTLPEWSRGYGWEKESVLSNSLCQLQRQAAELEARIQESKIALLSEERLRLLYTAKGDVLVEAVIPVFEELGIKTNKGEPGRDDLILAFEGRSAVVEVKGKKSSAAEADAAQLEKWVAGFKEEKGIDAKGILLINAFCDTSLSERSEAAFPHQMLKYSTQREHCLITTTQLLGLLFEARAHPEKRLDLVNELFSTVGVYQQFSDWRTFLTVAAPKNPA